MQNAAVQDTVLEAVPAWPHVILLQEAIGVPMKLVNSPITTTYHLHEAQENTTGKCEIMTRQIMEAETVGLECLDAIVSTHVCSPTTGVVTSSPILGETGTTPKGLPSARLQKTHPAMQ
eukprot:GHVU01056081.1.p3 GENE.GHVU01056081.1~~GHVU01056081.1.p3  ORF type:complete len:119 (+),score=14.18 GHVU01056081.1:892-1248(+)